MLVQEEIEGTNAPLNHHLYLLTARKQEYIKREKKRSLFTCFWLWFDFEMKLNKSVFLFQMAFFFLFYFSLSMGNNRRKTTTTTVRFFCYSLFVHCKKL